jgi:hypothetical protein
MDFVDFDLAKKLKEKGFDYPCIGHYVNNQLYIAHYQNAFHSSKDESLDAPTISQVLKWLRAEKKILVTILPQEKNFGHDTLCFAVYKITEDLYQLVYNGTVNTLVDSYEQLSTAGIEYVLDNLI